MRYLVVWCTDHNNFLKSSIREGEIVSVGKMIFLASSCLDNLTSILFGQAHDFIFLHMPLSYSPLVPMFMLIFMSVFMVCVCKLRCSTCLCYLLPDFFQYFVCLNWQGVAFMIGHCVLLRPRISYSFDLSKWAIWKGLQKMCAKRDCGPQLCVRGVCASCLQFLSLYLRVQVLKHASPTPLPYLPSMLTGGDLLCWNTPPSLPFPTPPQCSIYIFFIIV